MSAQLLDALWFAHGQGMIHRDVKPANVFLCHDGQIKVLDFGLVATYSQVAQGKTNAAGTLRYMAPEALAGKSDHRSDIWAAGITIYELITGKCPFAAPMRSLTLRNILHMPYPELPASIPHSLQLNAMLAKALHKDPSDRYADAGEFAIELRRLLESGSSSAAVEVELNVAQPDGRMAAPLDNSDRLSRQLHEEVVVESRSSRIKSLLGLLDRFEYFDVLRLWFFCSIFAMMVLSQASYGEHAALWTFGINFALMGAGYLLIGGPKLALIPLGMVDFWVSIPRCRTCSRRMPTVYQTSRFAFSAAEIQFAIADCVSALGEDLWEDAVKLFSIHTHEFAPSITNTVAGAPLRYQLNLCQCPHCGQRCARLITDEKDGERWKSRPEYVLAHKAWPLEGRAPSFPYRIAAFLRTLLEAVTAGFSRTAFPRALLIGLLALAVFFAAGRLILLIIEWSWVGLSPKFPRR